MSEITSPLHGPSPEFWEQQHRLYEECGKYENLSGYGWKAYDDILCIAGFLGSARTILDIGVGTCLAMKELIALGKEVHGIDCCETALARARKLRAPTYASPEALPDDTFDLALCHLVSQHLPDDIFLNLMKHALRSLKKGGTLAVQCSDVPGRTRAGFQFVAAGNILRDERQMRDILTRAGANYVGLVKKIDVMPVENVVWLGFHARKTP